MKQPHSVVAFYFLSDHLQHLWKKLLFCGNRKELGIRIRDDYGYYKWYSCWFTLFQNVKYLRSVLILVLVALCICVSKQSLRKKICFHTMDLAVLTWLHDRLLKNVFWYSDFNPHFYVHSWKCSFHILFMLNCCIFK